MPMFGRFSLDSTIIVMNTWKCFLLIVATEIQITAMIRCSYLVGLCGIPTLK